ncbi:MAG: enoyl-CoA hydratase-related protein [Myxococcota bacterium]
MSAHIQSATEAHVTTITIDRPEARNALTPEMYEAMTATLASASRDPDVRVVVFAGTGGQFTAGNDIASFAGGLPDDLADSAAFRFAFAIAMFDKPLVAAVDGYAIGVGATMLLHVDFVYATQATVLRFPFVDLGLVPEAGSSLLLPERVGRLPAAELLLLGEPVDATRAHSLGLVNSVVDGESALDAAMATAQKLAAKPPLALQRTRALLRQTDREALRALMHDEVAAFGEALRGTEAQAVVHAFLTRRSS